MEITEKEYKTCKYLIKSWEKKFKEREKRLPSKEDIKNAPTIVKRAYKIYWYAKTSILEKTIIEEESHKLNEEISLQTSISNLDSNTNKNSENEIQNNLVFNNTISSTSNVCNELTIQKNNESELKNSNTVWGDHLKIVFEKVKSNTLEKSSSSQFTEKLFKGSKFKKRNPRKSLNHGEWSKSSNNLIITNENSQSNDSVCKTDLFNVSSEINCFQDGIFDHLNTVKITTGKTFFTSVQPVNILDKTEDLTNIRNKVIKNKLDDGWLERCNKKCELKNTFMLESSKENVNFIQENHEYNLISDEDFIYSSEDEISNEKMVQLNSSSKIIRSTQVANRFENCVNLFNTKNICSNKTETFSNENVHVSNEIDKYTLLEDNINENNKNSIKRKNRISSKKNTILNIDLKRTLEDKFPVSKRFKTEENIDFDKDKKIKLLKQKVCNKTINDNFVSINLKKKCYTRGKNKITYAKYKKQQWKTKKKIMNQELNSNADITEVVKCFKCGDVGHFSNHCKKKNTLLPLEEYNEIEDSPFLTIEEAARIVKEKSEFNSTINNLEKVEKLDFFEHADHEEDNVKYIPSLCNDDNNEMLEDMEKTVELALKKFGYKEFRPGQKETIMRIVRGKSTLFVSSTGSGKSLCYQIPAYLYAKRSNCISLVISPLISLMEDQIISFPEFLNAACLHANQSDQQKEKIIGRIRNNEVSVLLISPETIIDGERGILGENLIKNFPPVAFVCIDEIHCVSQWSHNFRPSYLMIFKVLKERFKVRTFLGLTATATKCTIRYIKEHLDMSHDEKTSVLEETILPENLLLTVSKDEDKDKALLTLLQKPPFSKFRSIIIYCLRRNECERLATYLRISLKDLNKPVQIFGEKEKLSLNVEVYHAGISAARRKKVQNYFLKGRIRIVVATVAFGMGINKADIRGIIHYNMPRTFEHYVQEIGRAGRDNLPARCHLFFDSTANDLPELKRFIYANSVDRHVIRKLLQKVFVPCKCTDTCTKHEIAFSVTSTIHNLDLYQENISTLLCYLELLPEMIIKVLPPAYTICTVHSFNGELAFRRAAAKCPPLAFAIADYCKKSGRSTVIDKLEFSVMELANKIGWKSGMVKNELKRSEWMQVKNKYEKTGVKVTFQDVGFRVLSPGNLREVELDNALDTLYNRVLNQENTQLNQLELCSRAFESISYNNVEESLNATDMMDRNKILKETINRYFSEENNAVNLKPIETNLIDETGVICDIHRLVLSHKENTFTGRIIAKIFHGIESPNYPAVTWSQSPFWRCRLKEDFNVLCRYACRELVKLK